MSAPSIPQRPAFPRRRPSSFDAVREFQRQRTFSNELSARLQSSDSERRGHDKRVSFDPASSAEKQSAPAHSRSHNAASTAAAAEDNNILPLDPEKGELSPQRTAAHLLPASGRWRLYFEQEIAHNHFLEAQLLLLTVATGITDAVTTSSFRVFVSKQTGNTVYLALWAVRHPSTRGLERNLGVSIGCFVLGSVFFGHVGHAVRQRRRAWLLLNNLLQCALVYAAVALAYAEPPGASGARALLVVALLSFASGGQISLAVCVKLPELNTTMITGALIQLATDRRIFALRNAARDRRVLFYAALLGGAFIGSAATTYVGPQLGLLLNAVVKTLVCFSFFFNHGMLVSPGEPLGEGSGTATPFERVLWGD